MRDPSFNDRLRQRAAAGAEAKRMVAARLPKWRASIELVGHLVMRWLDHQIRSGVVSVRSEKIAITEELTGEYLTKRWIIAVGSDQIFVQPVATFVLGAFGRVDLVGPANRITFVRVDDTTAQSAWQVVDPLDPRRLSALNQSSFQRALLFVLGET